MLVTSFGSPINGKKSAVCEGQDKAPDPTAISLAWYSGAPCDDCLEGVVVVGYSFVYGMLSLTGLKTLTL